MYIFITDQIMSPYSCFFLSPFIEYFSPEFCAISRRRHPRRGETVKKGELSSWG